MSLFTIGDLHLSLGVPSKPMNVFSGWENHMELLERNWRELISPEDTVVLPGDTSWGMTLPEALADFQFIQDLPGQKILLKGNHDYWWNSMKKMEEFLEANGLDTLHILHNNHYPYGKYGICGSRGWVNIGNEQEQSAKVLAREVQRLEVSICSAEQAGLEPVVFLHYPPMFGSSCNYDILDVLYRHHITRCYYGHIHGYSHRYAITGERDGIDFHMVSSDYLGFRPEFIF